MTGCQYVLQKMAARDTVLTDMSYSALGGDLPLADSVGGAEVGGSTNAARRVRP
jgi:hypothetical protein